MRKSPGKWLKTVLFGKKSFRSSSTKLKNSSEKGLNAGYEAPLGNNSPIISEPVLVSTYGSMTLPIVEEIHRSDTHGCETTLPVVSQSIVDRVAFEIDGSRGCDKLSEEKAATKAQAAIRGFLARRAFQALKGIVRLQALIRGHLVRRQAVATLYAMHAILRVQAIFRGRIARHSDIGLQIYEARKQEHDLLNCKSGYAWKENFQVHSLGHKLLSSSVVFKPLKIQFNKKDPNSASNWLERWHMAHFWEHSIEPHYLAHSKLQQKKSKTSTESRSIKPNPKLTKSQGPNSKTEKRKDKHHSKTPETPKTNLENLKESVRKVTSKSDAEIGSNKSQSNTLRDISKNSGVASNIVGAEPSEASLSLPGDGESKKAIHKRKSLPSTGVEVPEKDLRASTTLLKAVSDAIISEEKSLSCNRESAGKANSRSPPLTTGLEIPEKELHASVSSSASNAQPDGNSLEVKPLSSREDSGNKSNNRKRSSLPNVSKTLPDGNASEEKSLSGSGDSGNKLNNRRRSSLPSASKAIPDGNRSEEKSLCSSGDSCNKSNNRRKSLSSARLELSENKLYVSLDKSASKITSDVNFSEENSLSSNGEPGNMSHNRRRSSFLAGVEVSEVELRSSASKSVPSYMATTESAKARLRGQNSPRVVTTPDSADQYGLIRRHSLPSGTANGKLKSVSPRTLKPAHGGGAKGLIKGGRSLNLSRDGSEKLIHAEWRRW